MTHASLDCSEARRHLTLHAGRDLCDLDGELSGRVERHVELCAACRGELAEIRGARERMGVLGARTAREVEAVDLWPALEARRRAEFGAPAVTSAIAARGDARRTAAWGGRRAWLPAALAAAAAVVVLLRVPWGVAEVVPPVPALSQGVSGPLHTGGPAGGTGSGVSPAAVAGVEPAAGAAPNAALQGLLRRAAPGDERLRDSSMPFGSPRSPWLSGGASGTPNSLASDAELR